MQKILSLMMAFAITSSSTSAVAGCGSDNNYNNYDLSKLKDNLLTTHDWQPDEMLSYSVPGYMSLYNNILKILAQADCHLELWKLNVAVYYGDINTANSELLVNFQDANNVYPVFDFSVHITPSQDGSYLGDKWLHVQLSKNLFHDFNSDYYLKTPIGFDQHPDNYDDKTIVTYLNKWISGGLNNLDGGWWKYCHYDLNFQETMLKGAFSFNSDQGALLFNYNHQNMFGQVMGAIGLDFQQNTPQKVCNWYVKITPKDLGKITQKVMPHHQYQPDATLGSIKADIMSYVVNTIAIYHGAHFIGPQDFQVALLKSPSQDSQWADSTKLSSLWTWQGKGINPYVYFKIIKSNNQYLSLDNAKNDIGAHILIDIGRK